MVGNSRLIKNDEKVAPADSSRITRPSGLQSGDPKISKSQPTEADFMRSFLNTTREKHRERLVMVAKEIHETNVSNFNNSVPNTEESIKADEYRQEKHNEIATKTYLDFLMHKRNQTGRERLYDLKMQGFRIAEDRKGHSMLEERQQLHPRRFSTQQKLPNKPPHESIWQPRYQEADFEGGIERMMEQEAEQPPLDMDDRYRISDKEWREMNRTYMEKVQTLAGNKTKASDGGLQNINVEALGKHSLDRKSHRSYGEGNGERPFSFPLEQQRQLREPSFLRDLDRITDKSQLLQLQKILTEGEIDWEKQIEGLDITPEQSLEWNDDEYGLTEDSDDGNKTVMEVIDSMKEDRDNALEYLLTDTYFPGAIDDAINGKLDFHQLVFDIEFNLGKVPDQLPTETDPISLVEAFDIRVERQNGAIRKATMQSVARASQSTIAAQEEAAALNDAHPSGVGHEKADFMSYIRERGSLTRILNREEVVLASTVGIDITNRLRNQPMSELLQAIDSLQKAEAMNDYDKSFQAAEEAYRRAPPELAETAAIFGARNFRTVELTKKSTEVKPEGPYKPIEIVSYVGVTKPMADVAV